MGGFESTEFGAAHKPSNRKQASNLEQRLIAIKGLNEPMSTSLSEQRDLVELLHSRGQRVTSQRLVILRELRRREQHATAEEIHRAVANELPGISVPTIYATLELFVELGLARRIEAGTAALYDTRLEPHQHAVCRRCGRVQDVDGGLNANALLGAARAAGFQPQGAELIISGLCAECAAETANSAA